MLAFVGEIDHSLCVQAANMLIRTTGKCKLVLLDHGSYRCDTTKAALLGLDDA
jgi:hypothetical protein